MSSNIIALDVGEKRVGIARASSIALLPSPYKTIDYEQSIDQIKELVAQENVEKIVVGLPMNIEDKPTDQTIFTQNFIDRLKEQVDVSIVTCDEALSSKRARFELESRKKPFTKEDIDSLAASYILEDYLREVA